MKKLILFFATASALYAHSDDKGKETGEAQASSTEYVERLDVPALQEQVFKTVERVYTYGQAVFTDMQNNPQGHVMSALLGGMVAVTVYRRFSSIGRVNRKLDAVLKILGGGNASPVNKESRKNVIIQ